MAKKKIQTFKKPTNAAEWLRSSLDLHGMTNSALAKQLGIYPTQISAWKNGNQNISLIYCRSLSTIFKADPIYVRNLLLEQCAPGNWKEDEELRLLGTLTKNESEFIKILRENPVANVQMTEDEKEEFRQFVSKLRDSRGLSAKSPDTLIKSCGSGAHKDIYYGTQEEKQKADKLRTYRAEQIRDNNLYR